MTRLLRVCAILFLVVPLAGPALAQGSNPFAYFPSQVIDEFAHGAGIAGDSAALSLGSTPGKLEKAQNYLAAVQIVSQLADARDDAAASTAVD